MRKRTCLSSKFLLLVFPLLSFMSVQGVAQDVNGDDFDDLAVGWSLDGASNRGAAGVLRGTNGSALLGDTVPFGSIVGLAADDMMGAAVAIGDVFPDGIQDDIQNEVIVGIPGRMVNSNSTAGEVRVYKWNGTIYALQEVINQSTLNAGTVNSTDLFGSALAVGDFDGDGEDDLAIGVPGQNCLVGSTTGFSCGTVHVRYANPAPLQPEDELLSYLNAGMAGMTGDMFGSVLAVGDFNADGRDDLVVGVPFRDVGATDAGEVVVFWGHPFGLGVSQPTVLRQGSGLVNSPQSGDQFGTALACGDMNGDGFDDLAIGVPFEDIGANRDTGLVHVLNGDGTMNFGNNFAITLNRTGTSARNQIGAEMGAALSIGDVNGNTGDFEDLAIGVPGLSGGGFSSAGGVVLMAGSIAGPTTLQSTLIHRGRSWVNGDLADFDEFGSTLAMGDYNGDGYKDLAVSIPQDDILIGTTNIFNAGSVQLFYGEQSSITSSDVVIEINFLGNNGMTLFDSLGGALD